MDIKNDQRRDPRQHMRQFYGKKIVFTTKNRQHHGTISNISRGGTFITTKYKFALGQMIILDIRQDTTFKARRLKGWVVRLSPNGVGIKFDRRTYHDRRKTKDRRSRGIEQGLIGAKPFNSIHKPPRPVGMRIENL